MKINCTAPPFKNTDLSEHEFLLSNNVHPIQFYRPVCYIDLPPPSNVNTTAVELEVRQRATVAGYRGSFELSPLLDELEFAGSSRKWLSGYDCVSVELIITYCSARTRRWGQMISSRAFGGEPKLPSFSNKSPLFSF